MTPEEIVAIIGNIANRPDIRKAQANQVKLIKELVKTESDRLKLEITRLNNVLREIVKADDSDPSRLSRHQIACSALFLCWICGCSTNNGRAGIYCPECDG